jgi:hypothetical protein
MKQPRGRSKARSGTESPGFRQLLERGGFEYTGVKLADMANAKKAMRRPMDHLPMFSPKALYLGMQLAWINRK